MTLASHKNGSGIVSRAKELRQAGSMIERLLWRELRTDPKQKDAKFRYQHPLSRYVVDFVCLSAKLVVEIDGMSHDLMGDQDKERQGHIESLGYLVLRFSNQDILRNASEVADQIRHEAQERLNLFRTQTPPRKREALSTLPQGEGDGSVLNVSE